MDYSSSLGMYLNKIHTKYGIFYVDKRVQTIIQTLPSYERDDIKYLTHLIGEYLKKKKKVLFIDVGAGIGNYSVELGNKFKKYDFHIIAFEPSANNFSSKSNSLLNKNIRANRIKNIKVLNVGLGDKNTNKPNQFGFITKKLDDVLKKDYVQKFDALFMLIDIEGYEKFALKGAKNTISRAREYYLLIEDCVDTTLPQYLSKDFVFLIKNTPYNSFWKKI